MNIILLGAPGSGKGTISEYLCEKNNFTQLSTGDLFRENISNKTPLGLEAQKCINEGKLVADKITNGMVEAYLASKSDNLIFDGYPRTIDQAKALDEMLAKLSKQIDKVIYLEVDNDVLMSRLTGRIICKVCKRSYHKVNRKPLKEGVCDFDGGQLITRPDDQEDKIQVRLQEYYSQTEPLAKFYENKISKIRADKLTPQELFEKVIEILNK